MLILKSAIVCGHTLHNGKGWACRGGCEERVRDPYGPVTEMG
jgi:hypothetical protein